MFTRKNNMRKTKIIATIGPATACPLLIQNILCAGADVIRLNLSHGDHKWHSQRVKDIRKAAKAVNKAAAIMLDLQGPRIRTGRLKNASPVNLKRGQDIVITTKDVLGNENIISTHYANLPRDVKKNNRILFDNGLIELKVVSASKTDVKCRVISGGMLGENKGMNLPGVNVSMAAFTEKDKTDLRAGLKWGIDYAAMSFVSRADDVNGVRDFMKKRGCNIPIIAKIERQEAIDNIDEILDAADGVMVARGDLGVEMTPQRVPLLQKMLIKKADEKGKIVITATQMLESMVDSPTPTRAEASDVANAVLDGTDAVMLSEETAKGKFPQEAVKMMDVIAREVEGDMSYTAWSPFHKKIIPSWAVAHSACNAADETDAKALVIFTISGRTALMVSKFKPVMPIIVLTPDKDVYNRLALIRGALPLLIPFGNSTDKMLEIGEKTILKSKLLKKGDTVVVVAGTTSMRGATNMMKVYRIGE